MVNIRTEVAYGNVAYQSSKGQEVTQWTIFLHPPVQQLKLCLQGHFEDFLPLDDEEMDKYPESPVRAPPRGTWKVCSATRMCYLNVSCTLSCKLWHAVTISDSTCPQVFRWVGIPTYTDLEVIAEECDTSPRAVLDMSAWTSKFDDEVSNIPQLPKPCLLIETSACSSSDIPVYLKRALRSGCSHASSINR